MSAHYNIMETAGDGSFNGTNDQVEGLWREAAESGEGTVVTFRVIENTYTRGYLYTDSSSMNQIVYDAIRGGASPEEAYCDGENPSGCGQVYAISPYTHGRWGLQTGTTERGWTPGRILDDAGLTYMVMDETTAEDGSLLYLTIVLLTPERRAEWLAEMDAL